MNKQVTITRVDSNIEVRWHGEVYFVMYCFDEHEATQYLQAEYIQAKVKRYSFGLHKGKSHLNIQWGGGSSTSIRRGQQCPITWISSPRYADLQSQFALQG